MSDSLYLTDANGTVYLAERVVGTWLLSDLYRLTVQAPETDEDTLPLKVVKPS